MQGDKRGILCPDQSLTIDDIFALFYARMFCEAQGEELKIVRCNEPYPSEEKVRQLLKQAGVTLHDTGRPKLRPLFVGVGKAGIHNGTGKFSSLIMICDQLVQLGSLDTNIFQLLVEMGSSQNKTGKLKQGFGIPYILRHAFAASLDIDMDEVIRRAIQVVELWVYDKLKFFKPEYAMNRMEECSDVLRIFDKVAMVEAEKGKAQLKDLQPMSLVWLCDRACGMTRHQEGEEFQYFLTPEEANGLVKFWYELSLKVIDRLNVAEESLKGISFETAKFEFKDYNATVARYFSEYGHWELLAWTRMAGRSEKPWIDLMVAYNHPTDGFVIAPRNKGKGGKFRGDELAKALNAKEGVADGNPPVWIVRESANQGDTVMAGPYKFSSPIKSKLTMDEVLDVLFEYSLKHRWSGNSSNFNARAAKA